MAAKEAASAAPAARGRGWFLEVGLAGGPRQVDAPQGRDSATSLQHVYEGKGHREGAVEQHRNLEREMEVRELG